MYGGQIDCPLKCKCSNLTQENDSQQHLLQCKKIQEEFESSDIISEPLQYSDIFGNNVKKLKELTIMFNKLLDIKEKLCEKQEPATLDPCIGTSNNQCNGDTMFTPVFIVCPSGNK